MLQMHGQCYHVIRMHLQSAESDFRKDTILGQVIY
jgi:hypothetical protein